MNFVPRVLVGVTMVKISTNVICLDQIFVMGEFVSIQMVLTDANVPPVTNWTQGYIYFRFTLIHQMVDKGSIDKLYAHLIIAPWGFSVTRFDYTGA